MKIAYADPPYLGQSRHYQHLHPQASEWDSITRHAKLVSQLLTEFPDGWALSASSPSLSRLLPMMPEGVRIAAWCKSFCAFKRGVRPAYAWEPVIFYRGRNPSAGHPHPPPDRGGQQTTPKDFLVEPITLKKGLTGAKPQAFCSWVLDLLGVLPGDEVHDLFPGTNVMGVVAAARGCTSIYKGSL